MKVVLVSGQGATGKTAIGLHLAERLGWDYFSKDSEKTALAQAAVKVPLSKWPEHERRAKAALWKKMEQAMATGKPFVADSNFEARDRKHLRRVLAGADVVEIYLYARGWTSLRRFHKRLRSGDREKHHHDYFWLPGVAVIGLLQHLGSRWPCPPMAIGQRVMEVDTTDFKKVNLDEIAKYIQHHTAGAKR